MVSFLVFLKHDMKLNLETYSSPCWLLAFTCHVAWKFNLYSPELVWHLFSGLDTFSLLLCSVHDLTCTKLFCTTQIQQRYNKINWQEFPFTYNMKSCSQQGSLPLLSIVVLFKFWTFKTTYVLDVSEKQITSTLNPT